MEKNVGYIYLGIAILAEVAATSALKGCRDFSRAVPSVVVVVGYAIALICLTLTLRTIPVGVAYAIWAGLGVALVALAGKVLYQEDLDAGAIVGMVFVVVGVVVMGIFSKTIAH